MGGKVKVSHTFKFTGKAGLPKNSLSLVYDLEGFSHFFNQPDVQDYVPLFLNYVSEAIDICLFGGGAYWISGDVKYKRIPPVVVHEKFMGDGALYILQPAKGELDFQSTDLGELCNRLWNLKLGFEGVVNRALEEVPVADVPRRIRFGLSRGTVYELTKPGTASREYIGFCVNQASRLQGYCPDIGFIASARLVIPAKHLKENGYKKVIATNIKGFQNEIVIVDSTEYDDLDKEVRETLFKELPVK